MSAPRDQDYGHLSRLVHDLESTVSELISLKSQVEELQSRIADEQAKSAAAIAERKSLEQERSSLRAQLEEVSERQQGTSFEMAALKAKMNELASAVEAERKSNSRLSTEVHKQKSTIGELNTALATATTDRQAISMQLKEALEHRARSKAKIAELQGVIKDVSVSLENERLKTKTFAHAAETAKKELQDARMQLAAERREGAEFRTQLKKSIVFQQEYGQKFPKLVQELEEARSVISELQKREMRVKKRLRQIESALRGRSADALGTAIKELTSARNDIEKENTKLVVLEAGIEALASGKEGIVIATEPSPVPELQLRGI